VIQLLRALSLRHLRRHRLRTFLTFLGIALGVATIIAIAIVNRTLTGSFHRTIELLAGKAVLQVVNGESGVRESIFPLIRDAEGVKDAAPIVEGFLPVVGFQGERLFIYGVDFLADPSIREHRFVGPPSDLESALDFIAQPDSLAITESFSRRLGLPPGSRMVLATSRGTRTYIVRALLREQGSAKVFGGSFALMDLPVAQIALGKEGKLDTVDLTIEEGEGTETVRQRIQTRLRDAAQVERPSRRGEQTELLLDSYRIGLFFVSLVALFVASFLIYSTVSVSVVERKREIGTLRCLGMQRRDVVGLFIWESLIIALFASAAGIGMGFLFAKAAVLSVGQTVSNLFLQVDLLRTTLSLKDLGVGFASGVGVSILAALYPAWKAGRVTPLEGYRQTPWSPQVQEISRAPLAGFFLLLLSPLIWLLSLSDLGGVEKFTLGIVAMLVFLLGLCFLAPLLIRIWVRLLRPFLRRLSWLEGELASDNLARSPVRCGIAISQIMISLAAIFTIAALVHSVRGSLLSWVDQMVTADLVIHSGARSAGPLNVPLKEELAAPLEAIGGVQFVDLYRLIRSTYEGKPIVIESLFTEIAQRVRIVPMVQGERETALREMAAGKGIIVSESFQSRFGKGQGDAVYLPTPSGRLSFKILGVYVDYSSDIGSVLIDRAWYKKIWHDDLVDAFDLWLAPGADQEKVIQEIKRGYGEKYQLFISTHSELRENVVDLMEQSFRVNYAAQLVAIIVAVFSVINTLLTSVLDRTREIGVLRALGVTQRQLRLMVMAEAGWMGLIGGLLGVFAGTIMAYHHVVYNTKALTGWTFQYHYPFHVAVLCLVLSVALCLMAGYAPARKAASTRIVEAIGYE